MSELPRLMAESPCRRRALVCTLAAAGILTMTPLVQFQAPQLQADEAQPEATPSAPKSEPKQAKDEGSELLRRLQRAGAPLLTALQEEHGYALKDEQNLNRIAPPFPDVRMEWYRAANPDQAKSIPAGPDAMFFRWEGRSLRSWGMSFGGYDLNSVLTHAIGVFPQWIEGASDIRNRDIPGDWIVRPDAPPDKIVADLETILNRELAMNVRLRFAEVSREVYVVRGPYEYHPLPGETGTSETQLIDRIARNDVIHIFGAEFVPNSGGGGGSGDFNEFCDWLGRWISSPIVSDLDQPPSAELTWRLHEPSPSTSEQRAIAHDPKLVLANVTIQTGLEFVREKRPVKMLVIEAAKAE